MEGHGAEFEGDADNDEYQAQFHQPGLIEAAVAVGENGGEVERTGCAVNHGNAVKQQAGCQRTQNKIFQRGFGGAGGIAAQGNHGVKRQRQQLQPDVGNEKVARARHHAHAGEAEQRQGVELAAENAAHAVVGRGVNEGGGQRGVHGELGQLREAV